MSDLSVLYDGTLNWQPLTYRLLSCPVRILLFPEAGLSLARIVV
jgi:hypothetical protein